MGDLAELLTSALGFRKRNSDEDKKKKKRKDKEDPSKDPYAFSLPVNAQRAVNNRKRKEEQLKKIFE